ncbi:peptidase S8/S53 domain-containing protein [Cercophora scortea]|uniref:Peptidase S8/S53 domain-containing protein n=1 Tax=Cercophora scortea TaxID=314031 RepID=A0AAE0M474_9PEZI|nr:peptidase S8/S53 domain-containing protein [Cercophora scortea]
MRFIATILSLGALASIPLAIADAPIKNDGVGVDIVVPDKYIVTYKEGADPAKKKKHQEDVDKKAKKNKKQGVTETIDIAGLHAYVVEIAPTDLKSVLSSDLVDYVEKDTFVNHTGVIMPEDGFPSLNKRAYTTQRQVAWGLGRISHRAQGSSDYYYDQTAGAGARVYVVDTGIMTTHDEFSGGRAVWGANFIAGSPNTDEHGHGTHVAGTIGGNVYGVAKRTTLVAVKVLDRYGGGTMSGLLAGINWVVADANAKRITRKAVINMSVGGSYTASVNAGVLAATNAGITVVVSAGNNNDNAAKYSPASAPSAITVGAVEGTDHRAWFSNFGAGVDLFAPGVSVESSFIGAHDAYRYLAGTSMASPHVAGLAAYFIAKEGLSGSAAVTSRILSASTAGVVVDPAGSPNRLAYNAGGL